MDFDLLFEFLAENKTLKFPKKKMGKYWQNIGSWRIDFGLIFFLYKITLKIPVNF